MEKCGNRLAIGSVVANVQDVSPHRTQPRRRVRSRLGVFLGLILLGCAGFSGYRGVRLARAVAPFVFTTDVGADGEVWLDSGVYVFVEPDQQHVEQLIITTATGDRLEVEPAPWPTQDDPPLVVSIEKPGPITFDSGGLPVTLGQSSEFTALLLIVLAVIWGFTGLVGLLGLVVTGLSARQRRGNATGSRSLS